MTLLLLLSYACAFAAAACAALRLGQSVLHTVALALLLFTINLIVPATYAGWIGQLKPPGLLLTGLIWWGLQIALVRSQQPLPEPMPQDTALRPRLLRSGLLVVALVFTVFMVMLIGIVVFANPNVTNSDSMWHYIPNAINLVQAGTLYHYNGISAYFPAAYEMLFAWEMTLARTFHHIAALQALVYVACVLYGLNIVRLLVKDAPGRARAVAICAALALLISMYMLRRMLGETSKNDLYALLCGLAALYYWLSFWHTARDLRLIALFGLVAGLAAMAKLTALAWSLALAGGHGVMLLRHAWGKPLPRALLTHLLAGGAGVVLAVFPWGVRFLAYDGFGANGEQLVSAVGSQHTVLANLSAAPFTDLTGGWLLLGAGILLGLALLLLPALRVRFVRAAGALLLAVCLLALVFRPSFYLHFGGWYTGVALSLLLIAARLWRRELVPVTVVWIAALALVALALHSIFPYSAWIDYDSSGSEVLYQEVNYRYVAAAFIALWLAVIVVVAHRLAPALPPPSDAYRPRFRRAALVAAAIATLSALAAVSASPQPLQPGILALGRQGGGAVTLDAWIDTNIRDATLYAINAPPIALYGQALSNRVYYAAGGHSGYFGDQAFRWEEIQRLIDTYDLDYIVISGPYAGVVQGELDFAPEVRAQIERMRAHLRTVYDDDLFLILAVPHAG